MKDQNSDYTLNIEERNRLVTLSFSGRIDLETMESVNSKLDAFWESSHPAEIAADLSGVKYMDSAGAMLLLQLEEKAKDTVNSFQFLYDDFIRVMTFIGELLTAIAYSLRHPLSVRWASVFFYMKRVGVDGLPIVSLISLLVGVIIAFMSSLQLKQFGATTYVAALVGFAMVRELGPLMTAIIVAGRSGSAFSAEIGSMMINEEVDALTTMGFDPIRFLAIPKVLASILVVPLLTIYAAFFGIMGGLMVGVLGLDLTVYSFIKQTMDSFKVFDVVSSLIKAAVFAMLISGIACQRGFQVRGGAEAVGAATTSAVVAGIFLIVLANSAFAIILYYIH